MGKFTKKSEKLYISVYHLYIVYVKSVKNLINFAIKIRACGRRMRSKGIPVRRLMGRRAPHEN